MKWVLLLWIHGCAGEACTIETYVARAVTPNTEIECDRQLEAWRSISPTHRGACVFGNLKEHE